MSIEKQLIEQEIIELALERYVRVYPLVGMFDLVDKHFAENAENILQAGIKNHSGWTQKE